MDTETVATISPDLKGQGEKETASFHLAGFGFTRYFLSMVSEKGTKGREKICSQ